MGASAAPPQWEGIQPGDVFFDTGAGLVSVIIRAFSFSPYAHCGVFHSEVRQGVWAAAEAYPGGLKMRERPANTADRVVRVWRDEEERQRLLAHSSRLIGTRYAYSELARIIRYGMRRRWKGLLLTAAVLAVVGALWSTPLLWAATVPLGAWITSWLPIPVADNPRNLICSNHTAQSAKAARPDLALTYPTHEIWPGRLERDLAQAEWAYDRENEKRASLPRPPVDVNGTS